MCLLEHPTEVSVTIEEVDMQGAMKMINRWAASKILFNFYKGECLGG